MKQIVIIPRGTRIPVHFHPDVVSYIKPLFGRAKIRKGDVSLSIDGENSSRVFKIEAGQKHSVKVGKFSPFIFLNTEEWINGVKPTSIENNWKGENL